MEEDIKILEDFIKYFEAEAVSTKYRRNISITVGEDDIEAIENLIKGYRELEKSNKEKAKMLTQQDRNLQISYDSLQELFKLREYKKDSIPKSKIVEKIEIIAN